MAETQKLEREYIIPLRREWSKVPEYKRTRKAIVAIKEFIAKHMKVPERDTDKVKLDVYFNNDVWFRGAKNAPFKVKVKAVKEGDIVKVSFVHIPEYVKFAQARDERLHKKTEVKKEEPKVEEKKEEIKTEEEKKEESEKEKSAAVLKEKVAEQQAKDLKRATKTKETQIHRMALKK